jgi:hypothetical protein
MSKMVKKKREGSLRQSDGGFLASVQSALKCELDSLQVAREVKTGNANTIVQSKLGRLAQRYESGLAAGQTAD